MNAQLMKLEELKAEAWVALDQARKEADAAVPGRRLMRVDLLSFTEALADPILGEPTAKAAVSAFATAQGAPDAPVCTCLLCNRHWANDRRPGAVAPIYLRRPDQLALTLICRQCVSQSLSRLHKAIAVAMARYFEAEEMLVAPGGRA